MGPLSRFVGKPRLSPWASTNVLPLTQVGNNTNSAISLTEIFDRVFSDVCNSLGFEVQKQKKRGSGNNRVYRNLNSADDTRISSYVGLLLRVKLHNFYDKTDVIFFVAFQSIYYHV